jgi:hypothetical protein
MIEDELKKNHISLLPSRDYEGHRVVYKNMENFEKNKYGKPEEIDSAHLFIFDRVCKLIDANELEPRTFTMLIDIRKTGPSKIGMGSFKRLSSLLKRNFKDRLHKLYIYPCTTLERLLFGMFRHFAGSKSVKKVILLSKSENLTNYFDQII